MTQLGICIWDVWLLVEWCIQVEWEWENMVYIWVILYFPMGILSNYDNCDLNVTYVWSFTLFLYSEGYFFFDWSCQKKKMNLKFFIIAG